MRTKDGEPECWFATTGGTGALRFHCAAEVPHGEGELVVETGRMVVLVATVSADSVLDVPAMRVRRELRAGEPGVVWFCPMREGDYPIVVHSGAMLWQGTLRAVAAGTRAR